MTIAETGDAVPRRGNWLTRAIAQTLFRGAGWRYEGTWPNLSKFVIVGGPHTSSWDFILTMAIMFTAGIRLSWLAKHTFVEGPFGRVWRWLGGVPVNRTASHGLVAQLAQEFRSREALVLALSPEGTRSRVQEWKTGFYHIATEAEVPIVPVIADYGRKVVKLAQPIWPSGDLEADLAQIQALYRGIAGKNPQQA